MQSHSEGTAKASREANASAQLAQEEVRALQGNVQPGNNDHFPSFTARSCRHCDKTLTPKTKQEVAVGEQVLSAPLESIPRQGCGPEVH